MFFRSVLRTAPRAVRMTTPSTAAVRCVPNVSGARSFSYSSPLLAKKKKKNSKAVEKEDGFVEQIVPKVVLAKLEKDLIKSVEQYKKNATHVKIGKADPQIFNHIVVPLVGGKNAKFVEVAQTTMKGNKYLTITVFDPANTKSVISAILGAGLNLNPEADPKNPQLLKVLLPNSSKDIKLKQLKELKELTDEFKTGHSNKNSLVNVRSKYMKQVKASDSTEDVTRKLEGDIEKLVKAYAAKLLIEHKLAEKSIN